MTTQFLSGITQATTKYVGEPTGFPNRTSSTIAFNETTRTFTITPVATSFEIFFAGTIHTVAAPASLIIPNTTGTYYIYFDADTKQLASYVLVGNDIDSINIISFFKRHVVVSMIYWDAVGGKAVLVGDERHGITMDGDTHAHLHISFGAQWTNGLAIDTMIVDANGSLNTHAQFDVSNGVIRDEDIRLTINDGLPQEMTPIISVPTAYRINGSWKITQAKNFPFVLSGEDPSYTGTLPAYNYEATPGAWALAGVVNNNFLLTHIVATNDIRHPIIAIVGGTYATLTTARAASTTELTTLTGLPFPEFVPLGTLIAQCSTTYANTPKAAFRSTSDGKAYVDWRASRSFVSATSSNEPPAMINQQLVTTAPFAVNGTATVVTGLSASVPLSGTYIVTYSIAASGTGSTPTSTKLHLNMTVNGVDSPTHARTVNVITDQAVHVGTIVLLNVNDTIALTARSTVTDGAVTVLANSILSYIRLS